MTGKELSGEGLRKSGGYAEHISFGIGDEYWYFGIVDFARPYPFAFNECLCSGEINDGWGSGRYRHSRG